jgi:hypothetical protein
MRRRASSSAAPETVAAGRPAADSACIAAHREGAIGGIISTWAYLMFRWLTTALRALPFWQRPVKASPAKQRPASRERTPPPVPADHVYTVEERRQALAFLARLRPELQAYAVRKMSPKLLASVADQILSEPPGVEEFPAAVRVLTRQFRGDQHGRNSHRAYPKGRSGYEARASARHRRWHGEPEPRRREPRRRGRPSRGDRGNQPRREAVSALIDRSSGAVSMI